MLSIELTTAFPFYYGDYTLRNNVILQLASLQYPYGASLCLVVISCSCYLDTINEVTITR
jgi:apolipoprotein N-acyltransferase